MSIFDKEEPYPINGTLEQKAEYGLEQLRENFYMQKYVYESQKEGGQRHTAVMIAEGPEAAERMAKQTEANFDAYLKNVFLTRDGETTDPKYPTTKMINRELRRIRKVIILSVAHFMLFFESMMSDQPTVWNNDTIYYNMETYVYRYASDVYADINTVIPNKKLPPRSIADLRQFIGELAAKYGSPGVPGSYTKDFLISRMREELTMFLLVDIPYNSHRLEAKTELIADEKVPKEGADKPVLH